MSWRSTSSRPRLSLWNIFTAPAARYTTASRSGAGKPSTENRGTLAQAVRRRESRLAPPQTEQQPQGGDGLKIVLPPVPVHPVELSFQPEGGQHHQDEQQSGQGGEQSGQKDKAGQAARGEGAFSQKPDQKGAAQKQGQEAGEKAARQKEGLSVPDIAAEALDGAS